MNSYVCRNLNTGTGRLARNPVFSGIFGSKRVGKVKNPDNKGFIYDLERDPKKSRGILKSHGNVVAFEQAVEKQPR